MQVVYYEFSHDLLLNTGTCYINLIDFTLSHRRTEIICTLIQLITCSLFDTHIETRKLVQVQLTNRKLFGLQFTEFQVARLQISGSPFRIPKI